jgi:thiamine phosphate synthase YjbQ (UPF0047 family)
MVQHTTASLIVNEGEPELWKDIDTMLAAWCHNMENTGTTWYLQGRVTAERTLTLSIAFAHQ